MKNDQLISLLTDYQAGKVFAYPTEAVFGLGCDPQNENAVAHILSLKKRPVEKGVILIASNFQQIAPYVLFDSLPSTSQQKIMSSWPGPVTWLLPKSDYTPAWISGDSDMVAVRITAHPLVKAMCDKVKQAFVSTSANPAGEAPAINTQQIRDYFSAALDEQTLLLVEGDLGEQRSPSKIFHSQTMELIRA